MTTIVLVRKNNEVVVAGDGQVSMGNTVVKSTASKVRKIEKRDVVAGFAGSTADALTLFERLEALHFGVADYAASLRARTVVIGGLNPDYPGDQWHHGLSTLVMTCRSYGLRAIDGPFGDFNDKEGYLDAAKRAAAIGFEGKWAIHPSQIDLANEVFSPPNNEVDKAKRILEELDKAAAKGKGAAQLDGRMIDAASARMAENIVNINKLIKGK